MGVSLLALAKSIYYCLLKISIRQAGLSRNVWVEGKDLKALKTIELPNICVLFSCHLSTGVLR